MLRIRLRRMGSRNHPFYRVVVSDSRHVPTGSALESIGHYDPRKSGVAVIDQERIDYWVSRGAQMSNTVAKLVLSFRKAEQSRAASAEVSEAETPPTETAKAAEAAEAPPTETAEAAKAPPAEAAQAAEAPATETTEAAEAPPA